MWALLIYVGEGAARALVMAVGPFDDEADAWVFHEQHADVCKHTVEVLRLAHPLHEVGAE